MELNIFWIEALLPVLSWICISLICALFFLRRLFRLIPEFNDFIVFVTLLAWIQCTYYFAYQVYHPRSVFYYYLYWVSHLASEAIELRTIYGLFVRSLRHLASLTKNLRSFPTLSILFFSIVALANFAHSDWRAWILTNYTKRLELIQQNLIMVECGLVFTLFFFSFLLALPREAPFEGILMGFAVDTAIRLIVCTIGIWHPNATMYWPLGRVLIHAASLIGHLVWLIVIIRMPKDGSRNNIVCREDLDSYHRYLESWTARLGEMLYQRYRIARAALFFSRAEPLTNRESDL